MLDSMFQTMMVSHATFPWSNTPITKHGDIPSVWNVLVYNTGESIPNCGTNTHSTCECFVNHQEVSKLISQNGDIIKNGKHYTASDEQIIKPTLSKSPVIKTTTANATTANVTPVVKILYRLIVAYKASMGPTKGNQNKPGL